MPAWLSRLFGRAASGEAASPRWVESGELRRRLAGAETPLIIDVRNPDEFDGPLGHIAGALNIPLPQLAGHMPDLARSDMPIVLVCLTDKRSSQAAADLAAAGIRDIAVLRGGIRAWRGG